MITIPVIKTRNIKATKCMSVLKPQEASLRMPSTGCRKRSPHDSWLK
tara:strand:+ start:90 stop:230 length:141 start_codon:yes stop_codon:yes gene_type:complete